MSDEEPDYVTKTGIGLIALMLWCSTGGLMFLHFVSVFMGATTLFFGILGFFIPPVGLINGLVYIVSGDSLQQYF